MEVIKYLNKEAIITDHESALEKLTEELGIKVSYNEDYDLYVLNYSQIDSPKTHPIVTECRSLVLKPVVVSDLNIPEFSVVSRSFDRFLNLGENGNEDKIDITKMTAHEKLDGSLIGLFYHEGEWLYRTKSMIMPAENMYLDAFGNSWKDLIENSLNLEQFKVSANNAMVDCTFILELTSPTNRIVTRYEEDRVTLLGIRENETGKYLCPKLTVPFCAKLVGWCVPKTYRFNTISQCKKIVEELPNLEEGYVLYDEYGVPQCKIKSPKYLAVHALRGECTPTPKRIMDLVFTKETDEYLTYFPEDSHLFLPYIGAYEDCYGHYCELEGENRHIEDQKEFALSVKDTPVARLLFQKRKNKDLRFKDMFNKLNNNAKYKMVEKYLSEH